jgi:mono/diheme cytochrome c family protein
MTRKLFAFGALAVLFTAQLAAAAGDAAAGKKTYDTLCFTCHGATGKGDGPAGAALNPPPRDFSVGAFKFDANKNGKPGEDADLLEVIKKGAGAFGGNPSMAPWGHLPEKDLQDVIAYIRTLHK